MTNKTFTKNELLEHLESEFNFHLELMKSSIHKKRVEENYTICKYLLSSMYYDFDMIKSGKEWESKIAELIDEKEKALMGCE